MTWLRCFLLALLILLFNSSIAQTVLTTGDIAFVGFTADNPDRLAFVLLKDVTATTEIIFTDKGWDDDPGPGFFDTDGGDGAVVWTATSNLPWGTTIVIDIDAPLVASDGTVAIVSGEASLDISTSGDQIFAIQGSIASPTFLAGVHWQWVTGQTDGNWDGVSNPNNTQSNLPDALTNGVNALRLASSSGDEPDNGEYTGVFSGDPNDLRDAINNRLNWTFSTSNTFLGGTTTDFDFPLGDAQVSNKPTTTDESVNVFQNNTFSFDITNFDFTDPDMGDVFTSMIVTSDVTEGTLFMDIVNQNNMPDAGEELTSGESALPILIELGFLKYITNGETPDNFQFAVSDGVAQSNSQTMTINVQGAADVSSIVSATGVDRSNGGAMNEVSWTVTFDNSLTGLSASNFAFTNNGLDGSPMISSVSGAGTTWTVTINTLGSNEGSIILRMVDDMGLSRAINNVDLATNLEFSGEEIFIDRTPPSVSTLEYVDQTTLRLIFNEGMDAVSAETIDPRYTISDALTVNMLDLQPNTTDVLITTNENINGTVTNGNNLTVTVTNAILDIAGNGVTAPLSADFVIDTQQPVITNLEYVDDNTDRTLRVTFSEDVTFNDFNDFSPLDVNSTPTINLSAAAYGSSNDVIILTTTADIKTLAGSGDVIKVEPSINVVDGFTNGLGTPSPGDDELDADDTDPTVTGLEYVSDTQLRVNFDEDITGSAELTSTYALEFDNGGDDNYAGNNITITGATLEVSGSDVLLDVEDIKGIVGLDGGDDIRVTVNTSVIEDFFDNPLSSTPGENQGEFTLDKTGPTVSALEYISDTELLVRFNEAIQETDANVVGNYTLIGDDGPISLSSSVLNTMNDVEVTITTSGSLSTELMDGETLIMAVARTNIIDFFGNKVSEQNTATLIWDETAPSVVSIEYVDDDTDQTLRVTFDDNINFTDQNDFSVGIDVGNDEGGTTTNSSVALNAAAYDGGRTDAVLLTTSSTIKGQIADGDELLVVVSGVTDAFGNALGSTNSAALIFDEVGPDITLTFVDDTHLRVSFGEPIADGSPGAITTPGTYVISAPATIDPTLAVLESNGQDVLLTVPDMKAALSDGDGITVTITASDIQDLFDNNLNTASDNITFDEVQPQVNSTLVITNPTTAILDVTFNEPVEQTSAETLTNYTVNSLLTPSAASLTGNTVTLTVDLSPLGSVGSLTVLVENVVDLFNNVVDASNDEATNTFSDAIAPQIVDLEYVDDNTLIVVFSELMNGTTALDETNYDIQINAGTPFNPDASPVFGSDNSRVQLSIAAGLSLVPSDVVTVTGDETSLDDVANNLLDAGSNSANFTFDNTSPLITALEFVNDGSDDKLLITFDEPIDFTAFSDFNDLNIDDSDPDLLFNNGTLSATAAVAQNGDTEVLLTFGSSIKSGRADGDRIQVTPNTNVTDKFGNTLGTPVAGDDILTLDLTAPTITALTKDDDTHLRVTFDDDMAGAVEDETRYSVNSGAINVISATLSGTTEVILQTGSLSATLTDGALVDVVVTVTGIVDDQNNQLSGAGNTASFTFDEQLPSVVSLSFFDDNNLDVLFSEVVEQTQAETIGNYDLRGTVEGVIAIETAPNGAVLQGDNRTVRLTIDDALSGLSSILDNGEVITVTADQASITDLAGNFVGTPNSASLTYDSSDPTLDLLEYVDNNTIRATFSEDLDVTSGSINDGRYSLDAGLTISGLILSGNVVLISTTQDINAIVGDGVTVTLTVTSMITDPFGNPIDAGSTTASFIMDAIDPTVSSLEYVADGSDRTLRVTFSEDILFADFNDFVLGNDQGNDEGGTTTNTTITLSAASYGASNDIVNLTTASPIKGQAADGDELIILPTVTDPFNNSLGTPSSDFIILDAIAPQLDVVSPITFIDNTTLILTFSEDIVQASAEDETNYVLSGGPTGNPSSAVRTATDEVTLTIPDLTGTLDNTEIFVTINNVVDGFENTIATNTQTSFFYDNAPPTFASGLVNQAALDQVIVTFDDVVDVPSGMFQTGFTIEVASMPATIMGTSGEGTNQITFTIMTPVGQGESVTIAYNDATGTVEDDFGNAMISFAPQTITNNAFGPASNPQLNCAIDALNLTWTRPPGTKGTTWDGVLVYGRRGLAVGPQDFTGDDLSTFTGDVNFGGGLVGDNSAPGNEEYLISNFTANADGDLTITNLEAGVTYHFAIYAYKLQAGDDDVTTTVTVSGDPTILSNFNASGGDLQVDLSWSAPTLTSCVDNMIIVASTVDFDLTGNLTAANLQAEMTAMTPILSADYIPTANWSARTDANDVFDITLGAVGINDRNYVVYNGSPMGSASILFPLNGIEYFFRAFLFDDAGTLVSVGVTDNATPLGAPNNPTNFQIECANENEINISWTKPSGNFGEAWNGVVVYGEVNDNMLDQTFTGEDGPSVVDAANGVIGLGSTTNVEMGASVVAVVRSDIDGDITISNIQSINNYAFKAYAFRDPGGIGDDQFSPGTSTIEAMNPGGITGFSAVAGDAVVDLSWTNPVDAATCIGSVLIIAAPTNVDSDLTQANLNLTTAAYTASSDYGSQTDLDPTHPLTLDPGNRVVYNGPGENVTVTNLTNATTYEFIIFLIGDGASPTFSPGQTLSSTPSGPTSTLTASANAYPSIPTTETVDPGFAVFDFIITDDGGSGGDDLPMLITDINIIENTGAMFTNAAMNWSAVIADATLSDGTTTVNASAIGTDNIAFNTLDATVSGDFGYIDENTAKTYTLRLWLNPGVANSLEFNFAIETGNITIDPSGSGFVAPTTIDSDDYSGNVVTDNLGIFNGNQTVDNTVQPYRDQGFDLTTNLTENNATVYYMVTTTLISPTTNDIRNNNGGVDNGDFLYNAGALNPQVNAIKGLDPAETYYIYLFIEDDDGNESGVLTTVPSTVVTASELGSPMLNAAINFIGVDNTSDNVFSTSMQLDVTLDEIGTAYYVVLPMSAPPPLANNIISGEDGLGTPAIASGQISITEPDVQFNEIIGFLAPSTAYDIYVAGQDDSFTTPTTSPVIPVTTDMVSTGGIALNNPSITNICVDGGFFGLADVRIDEDLNDAAFGPGTAQTLILTLSDGFEFDPGVGSVARDPVSPSNIAAGLSIDVQATRLTITYTVTGTDQDDALVISGLMVRSTTAGSGTLERLPTTALGGTASITGNDGGSGRAHASFTSFASPATPETLDATGSAGLCQNDVLASVDINALLTPAMSMTTLNQPTYRWYSDASTTMLVYDAGISGVITNLTTDLGIVTTNATTYTFYVVNVDGGSGCTSAVAQADIEIKPTPTALAGSNDVICRGDQILLGNIPSAINGTGSYNYAWTEGGGTIQKVDDNSLEFSPIGGTILIGQTVIGLASGATGDVDNIIGTTLIMSNVSGNFEAGETIENGPMTATASVISFPANVDFTGAESTSANVLFDPAIQLTGTTMDLPHTYQLVVTDANSGCVSAPSTVDITVRGEEAITFALVPNQTTFSQDNNFDVNITARPNTTDDVDNYTSSFSLSTGGAGLSNQNLVDGTIDFNPSVAGANTHILTYGITNDVTGCSTSDELSILVTSGIEVITGIDDKYCEGDVGDVGLIANTGDVQPILDANMGSTIIMSGFGISDTGENIRITYFNDLNITLDFTTSVSIGTPLAGNFSLSREDGSPLPITNVNEINPGLRYEVVTNLGAVPNGEIITLEVNGIDIYPDGITASVLLNRAGTVVFSRDIYEFDPLLAYQQAVANGDIVDGDQGFVTITRFFNNGGPLTNFGELNAFVSPLPEVRINDMLDQYCITDNSIDLEDAADADGIEITVGGASVTVSSYDIEYDDGGGFLPLATYNISTLDFSTVANRYVTDILGGGTYSSSVDFRVTYNSTLTDDPFFNGGETPQGCTSSGSRIFTIHPEPTAPTVVQSQNYTLADGTIVFEFCDGDLMASDQFNIAAPDGNTKYSWFADVGNSVQPLFTDDDGSILTSSGNSQSITASELFGGDPPPSNDDVYLFSVNKVEQRQRGVTDLNVTAIRYAGGSTVQINFQSPVNLAPFSPGNTVRISGATNSVHDGIFTATSVSDAGDFIQLTNPLVTSTATDETGSATSAIGSVSFVDPSVALSSSLLGYAGCDGPSLDIAVIIYEDPESPTVTNIGRNDDSRTVFDNSANNPSAQIEQEFIFEYCEDQFSVFGADNARKVQEMGNYKLDVASIPYTSLTNSFSDGELIDGAGGTTARISSSGGVGLFELFLNTSFNLFSVSSIAWVSGNTIRYNLTGPVNLTETNISDGLIVSGSTNSINDGDFIISAVNDVADYIDVTNLNRSDASDNEGAGASVRVFTGNFQAGETITGRSSGATGRVELDYRWFRTSTDAQNHQSDPTNMAFQPLHVGATANATVLELDNSGVDFAANTVGSPYEFYVVRNDFEDDHSTDLAPRAPFDGCFGLTTLIKVVIHPEPVALQSDPDQDNFFQKEFFLCENDALDNIVTPNINETFYTWYPDDGTGGMGLPGNPDYNNPLTVAALNDREITQAELEFGGAGQLDVTSAGEYYFWITQTTDSDGLTTAVGSSFAGCESDPTLITITVSPFEGVPSMAGFRSTALDVDAISFVSGNTISYSFNGAPDLSIISPSQFITVSGSGNVLNDGTFEVTSVDEALYTIEVTNPGRADNTADEASDSPASANTPVGTISNPATPPPGIMTPYLVNERLSYCVADITPDYEFTATSMNAGTNGLRFNWYESDKEGNFGTQLNVTNTADGSVALASELRLNGLAPIGSDDFLTRYVLVTQETDFAQSNASTLTLSITGGTFNVSDVVTGANGTALIESINGNVYTLNTVTGPFIVGETIMGATMADLADVLDYSPATTFDGCESGGTLFEIIIYDIPGPPTESVADLRDIYYCVGDLVQNITVTGEGNAAASEQFYWYNSLADAAVGPTAALATANTEGATITSVELITDEAGLSPDLTGTTLIPGQYTFFVTQAQDIESTATPAFEGCQSEAQEIVVHILSNPVTPSLTLTNMTSNQISATNLCSRDLRPTIVMNNPASIDAATEIRYFSAIGSDPFGSANLIATTTGNAPDYNLTATEIPDDGMGNLIPGTYTFYVYQISNIGIGFADDGSPFPGCASPEASVTFEVFPVPGSPVTTAPFVGNTQYEICQGDALVNMEIATPVAGETYRWYDNTQVPLIPGGTAVPLVTGSSVSPIGVDNNTPGTTSYFVTITEDGCEGYENIIQVDYVVNAEPNVNFTMLPSAICTDNGTIALNGSLTPAQGVGSFTLVDDSNNPIAGLVDDMDGDPNTVIFDPLAAALAALGGGATQESDFFDQSETVTITYSFTDNSNTTCVNTISQAITINGLPSVGITLVRDGLGAGLNEYCIDELLLPVSGIPQETPGTIGVFSSPNGALPITDNGNGTAAINLAFAFAAGVGDTRQRSYDLVYTFTNVNNCTNTTTQTIIINNLPEPEFEVRIGGMAVPDPGAGRDADFCIDESGNITLNDITPMTMGTVSTGDFSARGSGFTLNSSSLAFTKNGEGDYTFNPSAAVDAAIGQNGLLANNTVGFIDFTIEYTFQNTLTCENQTSAMNEKIIRVVKIPEPNISLGTAGSGVDGNEYCRDFGNLILNVDNIDFDDMLFTGTGIFREKNTGFDLEAEGVIDNAIAVGMGFFDQATFDMEAAYQLALANPATFLKDLGQPAASRQAEFVVVYDYDNTVGCGEDPNFSEEIVIRINPNPDFDFTFEGGALTAFCVEEGIINLDAAIGSTAILTPVINFTDYSVPSVTGAEGIVDANDGTGTLDLQTLFNTLVAEDPMLDPMDPQADVDIRLTLQDGNGCQTFIDKTLTIYNRPFPVFEIRRAGVQLPMDIDDGVDHEVCIDDVSTATSVDIANEVITLTIPGGLGVGESATYSEATGIILGSTAFQDNGDGTAYFYPEEAVVQATNQDPGLQVIDFVDFEFDLSITNVTGCTGTASQDMNTVVIRVYRLPEPSLNVDYDGLDDNFHYCIDDATPVNINLAAVTFDIDETGPTNFPGSGVYNISPNFAAAALTQSTNIDASFDPQTALQSLIGNIMIDDENGGMKLYEGYRPVDFEITYQYTTVEGCTNTSVPLVFTVNPLPEVTIDASTPPSFLVNEYCIDENGGIVNIDAFAFYGPDLDDDFTALALGDGTFFSNFLGAVTPGISPGILTTGPGRAQVDLAAAFDLGGAERRTHDITYEFVDNEGCVNSATTTIIINKKPVISFSGIGGCSSEPVTFNSTIVDIAPGDVITRYEWDFDWDGINDNFISDITLNTGDPLFGPSVTTTYDTFGDFLVGLRVTTEKTCESIIFSENAVIGEIPSTNFTYEGLVVDQPFDFSATPEEVAFGSIDTIRVNYDDGNTLIRFAGPGDALEGDDFNFQHQFAEAGVYQVDFTFITNNNCTRSHSRLVPVLPKIPVSSFSPYEQTFESSLVINRIVNDSPENLWIDGWVPDVRDIDDKTSPLFAQKRDSLNTWDWGIPSGTVISSAAGGVNAIVTNVSGSILPEEQSWIYTPVFDLTGLRRPMVRFDRITNFGSIRDGVVFEYSIDNGTNWTILGDYAEVGDEQTGIEWYDREAIQGNPGQDNDRQIGWGQAFTGGVWKEARHKLDEIPEAGRSNVIFRFTLGAASTEVGDGFGIDNFVIEERSRFVLLEQFSGTVDGSIGLANDALTQILDDPAINNDDGVVITYQTDLNNANGIDPINRTNPADPAARVFYYGVEQVPSSVLNGVTAVSGSFNSSSQQSVLPWDANDFNKEALTDNVIDLQLVINSSADDVVSVSAEMIAGPNYEFNSEIRLYLAVVEKTVESGGVPLRNVLRQFLPDASGSEIISIGGSGIETVSASWRIDFVNDSDNLEVIGYIQDNRDKTVLQAARVEVGDRQDVIVSGIDDEVLPEINLYPNPANDELTIDFGEEITENFKWTVYNQVGAKLIFGEARIGDKSFTVNTSFLPDGVYFILMGNEEKSYDQFKFMVRH